MIESAPQTEKNHLAISYAKLGALDPLVSSNCCYICSERRVNIRISSQYGMPRFWTIPMKLDRITLVGMVAMTAVSTDLYLSGIPLIVAEFNATEADGQLTLGIFMLGISLGQLVYGPLSDFYGRKPVLYVGLIAYIIASFGCAVALSMEHLLLARLLQALAAASGPVLARAIVTDMYQAQDAARVMATLAASMALIPCIAPVFGSWMLYWFDWRMQFFALMLVGLLVLLCATSLPESRPRQAGERLNFGKITRQFGLSLRHPIFMGYCLIGGAQFGALFSWISMSSFVVIDQLGVRPVYFGYTFAVVVCGYLFGALASSRMVMRLGIDQVIMIGLLFGITSALLMLMLAVLSFYSLAWVLISACGIFFSTGMMLSNAQVAAISVFPQSAGQASSIFGCIQTGLAAIVGSLATQWYDQTLMPLAMALTAMLALTTLGVLKVRALKSIQKTI